MKNNNLKLKIFLGFGIAIVTLTAIGYFKATPSPSPNQESAKRPQILVEPRVFDFGEVKFGQTVKHMFEVKNIGGQTLKINRVSTSCACTKAKIDKEKLRPGETASLLVTYDAGAMGKKIIGKKIERFVYIKSSDPRTPQVEITIYAKVK